VKPAKMFGDRIRTPEIEWPAATVLFQSVRQIMLHRPAVRLASSTRTRGKNQEGEMYSRIRHVCGGIRGGRQNAFQCILSTGKKSSELPVECRLNFVSNESGGKNKQRLTIRAHTNV
jgi:hypothetical protein